MRGCGQLVVAGAVGITGLILRHPYVEQLTGSRDVLGAPAIGEETVVTDTVGTIGQGASSASDALNRTSLSFERKPLI